MKLMILALEALNSAENRFTELLDAPAQIAAHVKDLARATAGHVKDLESRLAATEALLDRVRGVLEEVSGGAWNGLVPPAKKEPEPTALELGAAARAAGEERFIDPDHPPAITVVPIPLSPEIVAAQSAATEPSPG